jgi:hypothetical protein
MNREESCRHSAFRNNVDAGCAHSVARHVDCTYYILLARPLCIVHISLHVVRNVARHVGCTNLFQEPILMD